MPARIQPLFEKLPSGRSDRSAEEVAANQRERIEKAVVYAIANRGYHATTVADVISLAGVARRAFYELYENKEQCFLAAYDSILSRTTTAVVEAYALHGDWEEQIQGALVAMVNQVLADPQAARLVLIHSSSAGEASIRRRNQGVAAFEALIRQTFACDPSYSGISDLTVKAIVGGVRQIIYSRLRHGRAIELPTLVEDLLTWARSYRHPVTMDPLPEEPPHYYIQQDGQSQNGTAKTRLRGRSGRPRSYVIGNQRARILYAVAGICAEQGFGALTVPEIARTAGISHKTFYEHFASKDQAFATALEVAGQMVLNSTALAYASEEDWPKAVRAGITALTSYIAAAPQFARMGFVEVHAAGPSALAQRDQILHSFSLLLAIGQQRAAKRLPSITAEAIAGGIMEILYYYISTNQTDALPTIVPELSYIALAPFLGTEETAATLKAADEIPPHPTGSTP